MKERSPKFPFVSLAEAIEALQSFDTALKAGSPPNRETFLTALGYSSEHGAAMKVFAALRGYGLVSRNPGETPGVMLSDLGRRLLNSRDTETFLPDLRRAALSPPIFRRIWRKARHFSTEELFEFMLLRGFTEAGAKRASTVYAANNELARLAELQIEPDLPEDRRRAQLEPADRQIRRARERVAAAMERQGRTIPGLQEPGTGSPGQRPHLILPLSTGRALIPARITEEDFQLLMQTLRLWKPRLLGNSGATDSTESA